MYDTLNQHDIMQSEHAELLLLVGFEGSSSWLLIGHDVISIWWSVKLILTESVFIYSLYLCLISSVVLSEMNGF